MNLLYGLSTPVLFAHRGASALAPENTLAAFKLAETSRAVAVELDAKLSADGVVMVIHDPTLKRTTGVEGWVNRFRYEELKRLDAGSFLSPEFKGEKIPTLEEVFELLENRLLINVELTNYTSPRDALVEKVVSLVKKHRLQESVIFSSFSPLNLIKARSLLPEVPGGLLATEGFSGAWARSFMARWFFPRLIHPYFQDTSEAFIQNQHTHQRRVHVWTVNDPLEMKRLFKAGVDGIFTDDPLLAQRTLEAG
ncbi:MAG: glycerophosphodiester phosphodiesterase [Anaerolineae bacterium]|nr:glycerophosphodiester phosphodiesterase [Anaerolineae bacterium]